MKLIYKYFLFFSENVHFFFFIQHDSTSIFVEKILLWGNGGRNEKKNTTVNFEIRTFSGLVIARLRDLELYLPTVSYDYARDFSYRAALSRR